jgi:hypothetical protein
VMIGRHSSISFFILSFSALILILTDRSASAQSTLGAASLAMGQSGVALSGSEWSVFNNIALMPTDHNHISFYGYQFAGISEITDMALAGTFQTGFGTLGIGIHRYGFNLFNENRFLAGYKYSEGNVHFGASASYTHIFQGEGYGSAGAIGLHLGIAAEPIQNFTIGIRATHINQPSYANTDEELPREVAGGISYLFANESAITTELVKDTRYPVSFRTGLQIRLIPSFYMRTGLTTEPSTWSAGFGYRPEPWSINIAIQQHNPLGLSPALDFSLTF